MNNDQIGYYNMLKKGLSIIVISLSTASSIFLGFIPRFIYISILSSHVHCT